MEEGVCDNPDCEESTDSDNEEVKCEDGGLLDYSWQGTRGPDVVLIFTSALLQVMLLVYES